MKTATITLYHVYGTKSEACADITYRGKLLFYIYGKEGDHKLCDKARTWAHNQGFTHTRIILN